jgi:hypothetical protein
VFAFLRGEFVHLLNFNVQSNFLNHLFLPDETTNVPYDTKYTTQRGLLDKTFTLVYEKKNLYTYIMKIDPNELVRSMNSATVYSILTYAIVGSKDNPILGRILEKILEEMKDEISTKAYLKEILTGKERLGLRCECPVISVPFPFSFDIHPAIEEAPS